MTLERTVHDHCTSRKCARCGEVLYDNIINFDEQLSLQPKKGARNYVRNVNLCLVLGSSPTMTPTDEIPEIVGQGTRGKLVICHLQNTLTDNLAGLHIYFEAATLMVRVMKRIGISVPPFILPHRLVVRVGTTRNGQLQLRTSRANVDRTPVSLFKLEYKRRATRFQSFTIDFREQSKPETLLKFELKFMGHYTSCGGEGKRHCSLS